MEEVYWEQLTLETLVMPYGVIICTRVYMKDIKEVSRIGKIGDGTYG
jgi:hypothetical protein